MNIKIQTKADVTSLYEPQGIDYKAYAPHYDALCSINPAYQELLIKFAECVDALSLPTNPTVMDLGAGTGNFVCKLLETRTDAYVTHVDSCEHMNRIAQKKYLESGFSVQIEQSFMQTLHCPAEAYDLIVCVNALNNAPPARPILSKIFRWIKPGGYFFLIDIGREVNVADWGWFFIKHLLTTHGIAKTVSTIRRQSKVISISRKGQTSQEEGLLWTHTTDELLGLLCDTGFSITDNELCYRGYADLVVCQKTETRF